MAALLVAAPEPSLDHINTRRVSIPEVLDRLQRALRRARDVSFEELVRGAGRLEEAITFMAMLELARRGEATLAQPVPFGDIAITGAR
jgi:chromatin segregation and condensation protein Rec8/ScpA/Scc1 (kleisin family)